MSFEPQEKGVPIRQPATANLVIDSADRNESKDPNPFNFQITRPNSLLNGFFSRIGTTEVVLEWNEPNGKYINDMGKLQMSISSSTFLQSTFNISPNVASKAFYTAEEALNQFATSASAITGSPFVVSTITNTAYLESTNPNITFEISTCTLSKSLGINSVSSFSAQPAGNIALIINPDIRPYRYIDFTSQQLTYNQDLKDSSSAEIVRDVLCRWYFDWDNQPQRDGYGFPIEMGYEPFKLRRIFNPPKQIKWDTRQPIGNLAFQVYGNNQYAPIQSILPFGNNGSEWLMTLQVSET